MARRSKAERFFEKVTFLDNGCWQWTGIINEKGYGVFKADYKGYLAHRFCFIAARGSLDPTKQLHHLCENPACVNPSHLTPLTQREHIALTPKCTAYSAVILGRCKNNHLLTESNVRIRPNNQGRSCRECDRVRQQGIRDNTNVTRKNWTGQRLAGAAWDSTNGLWVSFAYYCGQTIYLGRFSSQLDAREAHLSCQEFLSMLVQ